MPVTPPEGNMVKPIPRLPAAIVYNTGAGRVEVIPMPCVTGTPTVNGPVKQEIG